MCRTAAGKMIKENEPFWFLVTHVEIEGQYLKIWAQTEEMVIQSVSKMLVSLQDKFDYCQSNIASPNNVMPHTQCCARGPNNEFSRAKILSFRSDGMVLVQFVDYGNVTHVPIHNMRLLDNLPGAEYLFSVPPAAAPFILADIMPVGGSWMHEVVKQIRTLLVNNKYRGVYREMNGCRILKFNMMNEDFGTLLVSRSMALYSNSSCVNNTQPIASAPVQSLRLPHQASRHSTQENWRAPAVPQQALPQKVVKTNSFKAIQLEIGSVHDVRVSYVDEGPCKFSVQLLEAIPYLEAMMKSINSRPHVPLQESPIAGTVCLGQETHPPRLCRVVLNSPGDTSCKVYYADYGHHQVLPFSSLYQIPDEFFVPNIFSIRFTLNAIGNWSVPQEMKDYFGGLVANKNLKLRVCKGPLSPLTQYCDLYVDGKNVRDILSEVFPESCELVYSEPRQLQIGSKETVMVAFVESTARFFVQIESDEKLLDDIMQQVEQASKKAPTLTHGQVRKDMPCIALYEDGKWYRALILQMIDDARVAVFYVDYGNRENVSLRDLRCIPSQLVKGLPKQAICCSLNGFQCESANQELMKKFEGLVLEERMILVAHNYSNGSYLVNLHDAKYISDPSADIGLRLRATKEPLQNQKIHVKNQESSMEKNPVVGHQRSQEKSQLAQKMRVEKKRVKSRDNNWTEAGSWNRNKDVIQKASSFDDNSKSKFRKDNENEQRHDNRFRRENSDHQGGAAPINRFAKEERTKIIDRFDENNGYGKQNHGSRYSAARNSSDASNERNSFESRSTGKEERGQGKRSNVNSRLDRSHGSDSDTSSNKSAGGKRNSRHARQMEDERTRDSPPNRNRGGRWENDRQNGFSNHKNDANKKAKSPKDARVTEIMTKSSELKPKWSSSNKIPPPNITVGAVKNCIMVYYKSPDSFYVQLCPDNEELHLVMDKIYSIYEKGEGGGGGKMIPTPQVQEGLHCIAQWQDDQQWYRALVKSVDNGIVTVHFVDYGNLERVGTDKIREIQPELAKLPAQAVHCKLFCPDKSERCWTSGESDGLAAAADDKTLEAEFVAAEQGVYEIILKDAKTNKCLNDAFANGTDLLTAKEEIREKARLAARGAAVVPRAEYAPLSAKWLENQVEFGKTCSVSQAYFLNPQALYLHLRCQEKQFRDMMNEIQVTYAKRQPISQRLEIGSSVMAVLPEDGVLYRASIVALDKPRGPVVQYVDYGDRAMVDLRKIYPVEERFMVLPKQALYCGLKNIAPVSGGSNKNDWSTNATEIGKFFNAEKYDCIFHELQNGQYLISLNANGADIGNALVQNGLAVFSSIERHEAAQRASEDEAEAAVQIQRVPTIDVNLLEGQTLHIKVSNVEGVDKFHVQFYTAAKACQDNVDSYMASKDEQMLKLPGQLAVMQNQALECSLFDVPLSSKADDMLKSLIDQKDVKIFVEKVERQRLIVRLFDMNGNKIKVIGSQNAERINPVCNLPILSSTHEVIVTNIKNSACVWLQRTSDAPIEKQLLDDMYEHYTKGAKVQAIAIERELFAGRWTDGNWYRVTVLELRGSDQVKVQLIDYGDTGYIPASDLRTLDPRFFAPHQLAIKVALSVTLSGSDDSQIELLEPLVKDKHFTATLYNVNRKWIAELVNGQADGGGDKLSDKLKALDVVKEAAAAAATMIAPFEHAEVREMVVGEKYEVMAGHVDAPNLLWLQRKEEQEALYDLHDRMQEVAAACPDYEGVPEEKSLCLAMYSLDDCWYRAEVIDADADITTVRFVDYGNTDVIDNKSAGRIKELPDRWKSIKRYAIACKLDVVPPLGAAVADDEWSEEACARIKDLASAADVGGLRALVIGDKAPMRVDLFLEDDRSVCELLVAERLAAYVESAGGNGELEEQGGLLLKVVEEEEEPFDPRSAFVSHIVSVDEFWVQEDAKVKELEMVADRLIVAKMLAPVQKVEEGLMCIAHYPEDNQYYRAVVVSYDDEAKGTVRVNYVDYGNSAVTADLRAIPQDLAEIPPLSKKCRLAKPDGVQQWPDNVNAEFDRLAANGATVFILDVIAAAGEGDSSSSASSCLVRMTHDAKDVAIELCAKSAVGEGDSSSSASSCLVSMTHDAKDVAIELCAKSAHSCDDDDDDADEGIVLRHVETSSTRERPAPIGEENHKPNLCRVSSATSPMEFWIQRKTDYPKIDDVLQKLGDSEVLPSAKDVVEGKILAVRYSEIEPQCYRCKVLTAGAAGIELSLIDRGTHASVNSVAMLRELPDDLAHIPPLAVACRLEAPPKGLGTAAAAVQWPDSACRKFKDLTEDNLAEFEFEILDTTEKPSPVALYYKCENVAELLLSDCDQSKDESSNSMIETSTDCENILMDSAIDLDTEQLACKGTSAQEEKEEGHDRGRAVEVKEDSLYQDEPVFQEYATSRIEEKDLGIGEKIVPGSISRGLSIEEIARYSPVPSHPCHPEEKIVPGSINKGHQPFQAPEIADDSLSNPDIVPPVDNEKYCGESKLDSGLIRHLETICFDDKVVPSCISRGETPIQMDIPTTPKTAHSEKLVAGAVNAQSISDLQDDEPEETLSVEVKENIPEAAV